MKFKKMLAAMTSFIMTVSAMPTAGVFADNMVLAADAEVNAEISGDNTVVSLNGVENGTIIAVKYDKGKFADMRMADVTGNSVTINNFKADSVFVWDSLDGMKPMVNNVSVKKQGFEADFTKMSAVPVYSKESGQGFVTVSGAIMPSGYERKVAGSDKINISENGAEITENGSGAYLKALPSGASIGSDDDDHNYGGLIYRFDTGAPGAYHIEVEAAGTSADTSIAPTGMEAGRLTGTSAWDVAGLVNRETSAKWEASKWSYDFATGEDFIEIEIEPKAMAATDKPQTVGVKSIKITPIDVNAKGDKPTIHILGDSTQKTYTFLSSISSWGQTLTDYFDHDKVNVVNYSTGGRAMKANYFEGRFDDVLLRGKAGDYVFIHSAHNDETGVSAKNNNKPARFVRGCQYGTLAENDDLYNKWLDMYVSAVKARSMTPVLVTAMPRTGNGRYSESSSKPNGFNPDSPKNLREKAKSDSEVGLVELYSGAKAYIDKLDAEEINGIYNSVEAGESPSNEKDSTANGNKGDGTHYRESASRQWCRIMLQDMYDQSVANTDTYTDKNIMTALVEYMKEDVKKAAQTKDWSKVFPECALDVSAVDIVPGAEKQAKDNYYYRVVIEKMLQLGAMKKDADNNFKPNSIITVGEFARGVEKVLGLGADSLTSYTKTKAELDALGAFEIPDGDKGTTSAAVSEVKIADDKNADLAAGEFTVTVKQNEGGKVTIFNESKFKTATADVETGVTDGKVIADNDYFTFTAPSTLRGSGNDSGGKFSENSAITGNYFETRVSGSNDRFFALYAAKETGKVTAYMRSGDNKEFCCENLNDSSKIVKKYPTDDGSAGSGANVYKALEFDVVKGETYKLYTSGGTGRLFGVSFASEPESSDSSLLVSAGEKVRVLVQKSGVEWLLDGIYVDNVKVSSEESYSVTISKDSVIEAKFIENPEPKLVETTIIASDAPLTREAMGAVLYDAYLLKFNKKENGEWNKPSYMVKGNYETDDPNIVGTGSSYYPLRDWSTLKDLNNLHDGLYGKVKEAYNLGLMRTDTNVVRNQVSNGSDKIEGKMEVTRAKAAKTLNFMFVLGQDSKTESQVLPEGNLAVTTGTIAVPNENASAVPVVVGNGN